MALTAAAGTVLAGCGVPVGGHPATIARQAVPYGLLSRSAPKSPTTTVEAPSVATIQIFLVGPTSHVVPEARDVAVPVAGLASSSGLTTILQALFAGPTLAEAAAGLQGAVPNQTRVLAGTGITAGVATVNLSTDFGQLAGQAQIEAVAQVVYTVIGDLPQVTGVTFEIAGQHESVPTPPQGALANVATRTLYASLGPL